MIVENFCVNGDTMNEVIGKSLSIVYRYRQIIINYRLKPYNLGSGQHVFLLNIAKNEGINQKDLTNLVMMDKATTAKALKKLEEHGYIYRQCNQKDRRYNQLFLTEKGHEMLPIITSILMEITEELTVGMTKEECQYFATYLDKMLNNAVEVVELLRNENK